MRIKDMVSLAQYKKLEESFKSQRTTLLKAGAILDAPPTRSNFTNAVIALEALSSKNFMMKFINAWIMKSAKSPTAYCRFVKEKCAVTGRIYNGFNKTYMTFNNLPDWFVYEAFKERAIKSVPGAFSLRFRDSLVAFILNQKRYVERQQ